jgi:hypothetical protein
MPKMKWVITVMALVGVVIIGEAVYVFTRPAKITLNQGLVLIGIAILALFVIMFTLWKIWRGLSK